MFNPISLDLQHGESIAIVGSSGCGKTTFLKVLSGLWPYSSGVYSPPTGKTLFSRNNRICLTIS
ncbi:TPA: ATP-binding cassette domain-containing protein [Klebsiella variicola]|uniref:ATP-binding cassette domain-containing protein n=1 Tax=Klebsiella variicola TaxID=244366 RepID=UPI0023754BE8|nr:ATP-binding cassette domain-containing protein [Klebsiella variicola]EKZ5834579.1 ATP-binding cassette domain-containing protein [Klebsiella variicola]HBV7341506.1 ATP-binding cassette domain-containing protein [Klebsiella variicola]HCA5514117.1 ATP-binding cassette domain-containing protein [Klebsiella variicola]HDK6750574.1 ATP-binding cassette domain-containing protein [Klebsiella variicola]